jgi:hypothetical protein
MDQKPSIGRIVHFVEENGAHSAAIVTGVQGDVIVGLLTAPFRDSPMSISHPAGFTHDESGQTPATWHWPERE